MSVFILWRSEIKINEFILFFAHLSVFLLPFSEIKMCKHLYLLPLVAVLSVFIASCGGRKPIVDVEDLYRRDSLESAQDTLQLLEDEEEPPEAVDGLFDDFFFTFVTNQGFQMQRISFPLPCTNGTRARTVNKEDWEKYNKFIFQEHFMVVFEDDDDIDVKNDTAVSRVSVEWIDLQEDSADVYTFRKEETMWMLSTINQTKVEELPNGEFLRFFRHFVCDSVFQTRSIDNPLKVITSEDTEEEQMVKTKHDASDWRYLKEEYPLPKGVLMNIDYGQPSSGVRLKQVLLQSMNDNMFFKFKFHKYRQDWKLIEIEN